MSKSKKGATKAAKASVAEEEAIVLELLERTNRPHSVANIVDSLQTKGVKKAGTERSLASLVSKGIVTRKEYGKTNIFIIAQERLELPDQQETENVDAEIKDLTTRAAELDDIIGGLRTKADQLNGTLSAEEAQAEIERLTGVVSSKQEKLASLGDGSALLTKDEKLEVEVAYFRLLSAWKKRKKMVKNIADVIGESSGMKPKAFYEEVGVEVDEEVNTNIADFPDIPNPTKPKRLQAGGGRPKKRLKSS